MLNQLVESMQKYAHVCPDVENERCSLCQQRWDYEKHKLLNQKKWASKGKNRRYERTSS